MRANLPATDGIRCNSGRMARFLIKLIVNAVALWFTTLIVSGVHVLPYAQDTGAVVLTYLVALIFGLVNTFVGGVVRFVALPLYILTLGLLALIVNGLLLMLVGWISSLLGFGLVVDGFWWGVLGALVLGIISWLLGVLVRPATPRR